MANPASRLSILRSCITLLGDSTARDDKRLEAAEQISDELQFISESNDPANRQLLEQTVTTFLTYLETTEPQFIGEKPCQKLRKLILEMIHRLPTVEALREHVSRIIKIMFRLFEIDNEENVGIVLRIIVELHKAYKPEFIPEIHTFLETVKNLYSDIKNVYNVNTMFEERRLVVKELTDQKVDELLSTIHTITNIEVETPSSPQQSQTAQAGAVPSQPSGAQTPGDTSTPMTDPPPTPGGVVAPASVGDTCSSTSSQQSTGGVGAPQTLKQTQTFTLLPKANQSIRVIAELPIIVVLLYQMYKAQLQQPLEQLLPLVLETTVLRPPENIRHALKNSDKLDKEIYVEFISAQIKCLSFVAYLVRIYTGTVAKHHQQLTQGLLALLNDCPHEVVSVRKELIAASKYIFQTDLRDKFIEHLHTLCNDDILVGKGYTVHETLRPQAYHILVDLLSNYKGRIKHRDLIAAVNLFAKNLHDSSLPPHVQLMSCRAFNNLVAFAVAPLSDENISQSDITSIRDLLMRIIEVFVLKFKNIVVFHLPHIRKRIKAQQAHMQQSADGTIPVSMPMSQPSSHGQPGTPVAVKSEQPGTSAAANADTSARDDRMRYDFSPSPVVQSYNIMECKSAIKSLVYGVKNAIEAIPTYKSPSYANEQMLTLPNSKLFQPKETIVLVRLLKYGLKALDIFTLTPAPIPIPPMGQLNRQQIAQATRGKEEKELLESFASLFTNLHPLIFQEVFSKMIDFLVERTRRNVALLAIINFIISAPSVSPIFSTILSEYLIERMEDIGSNDELSSLYLRMFKMVFASVTLYPVENEQMLKPLLHSIVNKSVELALSAKEPYNYFLLLRALFRSIGGGSHDQLYAEFLPLLPNLLQGLNSLQSGQHKQHMKDLFTELCLTVPVRLSSLMPFMPTLIYPLVSALNGPHQLVSQGLRTLELCVDNLSPDYLYDLLQPVRAELMQGLWRTVRHPSEPIAQNCLRVLGKFGGNNRRMLIEPQKLTFIEQKEGSSAHGVSIVVHFPDQKVNISLPIDNAVHVACETLKQAHANSFYKAHSWELIKGLLVASIGNNGDHSQKIKNFFSNPNLATAHIPIRRENLYKCPDQLSRSVYKTALIGAMMAASARELRNSVVPFLNAIVRHHVMLSIGQHLKPQSSDQPQQGMDSFVLVDALAVVIGHDEKELCKPGYYVMALVIETATMLLGSKERACELPLVNYLVKSMYELCYTKAWFSKVGGCVSIRFFTDNMPLGWLFKYLTRFVRALLYVMSDLAGELSSGAVDMAQTNLEKLLTMCGKNITPTTSEETVLAQAQQEALREATELLIKEINSQNLNVRMHSMKSIELIAKMSNKTAAEIMEPHREVLKTMLPFLATPQDGERQVVHALEKQPVRTQIGIIHGSTFCTNLEPKVFTIDTSIAEHKLYVDHLIKICEGNDSTLKKLQCYAKVTNLAPVRSAALHALASLHYLKEYENTIFKILFKSTEPTCPELQAEAYTCLEKFASKVVIDPAVIQTEVAPLLERLEDSNQWDFQSVKRLICTAKLFPSIFDGKYCHDLLKHLTNISKSAMNDLKTPLNHNEKVYERTGLANEKIKICAGIIELLYLIPTVEHNRVPDLIATIFKVETSLTMETGSPLRAPLKKFLRRVPDKTINLLLIERNLNEQQVYRLLKYLLKGDDGDVFRNEINQPIYHEKLCTMTKGPVTLIINETDNGKPIQRQTTMDLKYQAILIISIMIKYDNDWLVSKRQLVEFLKNIWMSEEFHQKHTRIDAADYAHWKEPKLLLQCLLNYFCNQTSAGNKDVIKLLFQLLRVFMNRYLCDFEFFRLFLEKTVIETYSIEWKRDAFAKFVSIFHDPIYPQKLKAKILQYIIIPSFSHSFDKGLGEALLGGPPQPERENPNNLIHMFINQVIDPICCGDKKIIVSDDVRILLLQFSCLLVDQASPHIHEATNRRQSSRLKKLVTLAWPCLLNRSGVDPAAKYHGHSLLSHIIAKFAVHKRIIIQVFHSLLKASTPDARVVVRQALDILLPAIPNRLEEGNSLLLKWTKKIIIEEGHTMNQLIHMLQLLVRHYRLYYPIRAHLIPLMIDSIQKLGYSANSTIENRKTAVDLCEVIMRWEMFRQKELRDRANAAIAAGCTNVTSVTSASSIAMSAAAATTVIPTAATTTTTSAPTAATVSVTATASSAPSAVPSASATGTVTATSGNDSAAAAGASDDTTAATAAGPAGPTDTAAPTSGVAADSGDTKPAALAGTTGDPVNAGTNGPNGTATSTGTPGTSAVVAGATVTTVPVDAAASGNVASSNGPPNAESATGLNGGATGAATGTTTGAVTAAAPSGAPSVEDGQNVEQKKPPTEDPIEPLEPLEPLDSKHVDAILNALLRLACIVNPGHCDIAPSPAYTTCKNLSDRCITLIKKILLPEVWGGSNIVSPDGPTLTFSIWMSDLLCSVQNPNCNIGSISGALELLTYLCSTIKREAMLASLKNLSTGIIHCARSHNSRIIRSVSNLVQRVMCVFPVQPSQVSANSFAAPHEELEVLYNNIYKVILAGLNAYEQNSIRMPEHAGQPINSRERDNWQALLFSSLMLMKAACINNPCYIDKAIPSLLRVIHKMTREHINHMIETTPMSIELLILGLDLVKNRLGTMGVDHRKQFIQQILSNLIESPTSDAKVLKAVVRIVEEWMKQKQNASNQGPNLREKTLLLIKLMLFIEKRFPTEPELNSQFLELIYYVYRDDELKATDLTTKLESAFMAGLRCVQPQIRAKFFQIYDQSVKQKLYERLMYIVCAQNWQQIGCHFWIQQCIEFILAIALAEFPISTMDTQGCLPCVPTEADLGSYNPSELESSSSLLTMLSNDANTVVPPPEDIEFNASHDQLDDLMCFLHKPSTLEEMSARKNLQIMVNRQVNFLEDLKKTRTGDLLRSLTQLCHMSVGLAKVTWINMFPRIWKVLNDQQMTLLGREIVPFLCSGAHVFQRECNPSAVGAFMEAVSRCQPHIQMRPILIKYLGKNHNIWHRAALMLEDSLKDKSLDTVYPIPARSNKANQQNQQDFDIITLNTRFTLKEEAIESISDILELLREDDMWSGLWQRKAQYEETKKAVLSEQQGQFAQAQEFYEAAMDRQRVDFDSTHVLKPGMKSENRVWEKHWIRCTKELNQWDSLLEYGSSKACTNPLLVLESAWRVPNWQMMKDALVLVGENCPANLMWRLHLYKGYNYICNHEDVSTLQLVDESFHLATSYCIQTWKKLPHIITNAHIPLLQASQQLLELNEAKSLHLSLYGANRYGIHELRTILKAWPKRVPILLDDLSYWSDILTWRQHQYQTIVAHFENQALNQASQAAMAGHPAPVCMPDNPASVAMQGAHFSAQGIISFGTIARKQGMINVCLDAINRIHTIPSVPIFDCYQKIRQQIKCYLQMPISPDKSELLDGIDIIECTNLKYFQKEYISEFYTYKGIFLSRLGRLDDANKAFSAAAQLNDAAPKAWSAWGDYLESRFTQDNGQGNYENFTIDPASFASRQMDLGVSAMTCFLQACRFYPEPKARKYLAKVLWLLSYDNNKGELVELINKYSGSSRDSAIPPTNWIVWIPQILQCLMLNPDADILRNLLVNVGRHSPQAVYFPVRTLLCTLKIVFAGYSQKMRVMEPMTPIAGNQILRPPQVPQTPHTPMTPMAHQPMQVDVSPSTSAGDQHASTSGPSAMQQMGIPTVLGTTTAATTTTTSSSMPMPSPSPSPSLPMTPQPKQQLLPIQQPGTPRPVMSPQSFGSQQMSATSYQSQAAVGSPSTSTAGPQQSTLIHQLQQPPTLLAGQSKTMPSPGGIGGTYPQSPQSKTIKMRTKTVTRCSEIIKRLHESHPTTISSLEGITDQMVWLKDYSYEEVQRQIQQALTKCYASAFENMANISEQTVSPQTQNYIRKLVSSFGVGITSNFQGNANSSRCGYHNTTMDYLALRNQKILQDPEFQQTKVKFRADFEESQLPNMKLITLIAKLKNWINILGQKKKLMPKTFLMEDKCRFLSNFSQHTAEVEIPGDALMPKSNIYYVRIARFIPEVTVVEKHNTSARRILIRGHNGKIYPYLVLNDSCVSDSRREVRVLQMLRLLNQYLITKKESGRRFLQFTVPRVVAISPNLRLVEDNPCSLSLTDILKRRINHNKSANSDLDQESPISEYYDRLMKIQAQNGQATQRQLCDIFVDIQNKMVPKTLLKDWAAQTYINATDYWVFRSQFTYQLALACFCEYVFHLSRMMPENMYVHQDTGQINVSFYKFEIDDSTGELKGNRPVPFRLTPNLSELITSTGVVGPFRGALDAVSKCLTSPQQRVISIFRAILRDEMLFSPKRGQDGIDSETLIVMVNRSIGKIYSRLNAIARPLDGQASQLISQATSVDSLCQMDPAWQPWL